MELFNTIVSGVLIFTLGQLFLKMIIDPIHELKKEIASILDDIIYYANRISNPNTNDENIVKEISSNMRKHASKLSSFVSIIPLYSLWVYFGILPEKKNIEDAVSNLIRISNSIHPSDYTSGLQNGKDIKVIYSLLSTYSKSNIVEIVITIVIITFILFLFDYSIHSAVKLYCNNIISNTLNKD